VLADPRKVALGGEPVRVGGRPVGRVTSAGFGHTPERSIAYAYLPPQLAAPGTAVQVDLFGEQIPAQVTATPLYDPSGSRLR
jgi:glycine cleavage system aminomethyltransferase T